MRGVAHHTPMTPSTTFSAMCGAEVVLKLENLQRTGSFKVRGATNRIAAIPAADRARGVVAASAGNHAQGVALAARHFGVPAHIVMPERASLAKAEAVRSYGASLELAGADYNAAEARAREIEREQSRTFVHAFDDEHVIAGQGVVGLEILEDMPDVDTIVLGVGGGGLIAGVATAVRALRPDVRIIGVEPTGAAAMHASLEAGRLVTLDAVRTIADGLATRRPGDLTYDIVKQHVDEVVTVDDDDIAQAILLLMERAKTIVEGAGAAGLAALLAGKVSLRADEKVAVVLSGGNIDVTLLDNIIQRGLAQTGRALRLRTVIEDRPGALRDLLDLLAQNGANIQRVDHDRTRRHIAFGKAWIELHLDTRSAEHVAQVLQALGAAGYEVETA